MVKVIASLSKTKVQAETDTSTQPGKPLPCKETIHDEIELVENINKKQQVKNLK